jgi:hypothetical protein
MRLLFGGSLMKWPKNGNTLGFKFRTFFTYISCSKMFLYFGTIWLGSCFGYFSKNWAIVSKSSGHPDPQ